MQGVVIMLSALASVRLPFCINRVCLPISYALILWFGILCLIINVFQTRVWHFMLCLGVNRMT